MSVAFRHHERDAVEFSFPHLPGLERETLFSAVRFLDAEWLDFVLRNRILPVIWNDHGGVICAAASARDMRAAHRLGLLVFWKVGRHDLLAALSQIHGERLAREASRRLTDKMPDLSARESLLPAQRAVLIAAAGMIAVFTAVMPGVMKAIFIMACGLLFLAAAALRLAAAFSGSRQTRPPPLPEAELPVYTVLTPLYREASVIRQLVSALLALDYPVEKLDIKIVLESSDTETRRALRLLELPPHMEVIIVPDIPPRTKPKALEYARRFARGRLLVIYDAEDIPHPLQLRRAAEVFASVPADVACLQASLNYYNPGENWLSRMFTIEYAGHFDVVLPFMAAMGVPLPLGGTSNHFRLPALERTGGWDPHNVTEDADLGIRLARRGYRALVLHSLTREEACCRFLSWVHQRSRWIKGFMQTWFVHMRHPVQYWRETGWGGALTLHVLLGGGVLAALAHPFFLFVMLRDLIMGSWLQTPVSASGALWESQALTILVSGYGAAFLTGVLGLRRRNMAVAWLFVFTVPVYWLMISMAAWLAVRDFIVKPHHWRKTRHGVSRGGHRYPHACESERTCCKKGGFVQAEPSLETPVSPCREFSGAHERGPGRG